MKVNVRIKRIDRGRKQIQNLLRSVRDDASFVKVGLLGSKKAARTGEKFTNAQLGIVHEFGTARTPARPFIGPAFRQNEAKYKVILSDLVTRLVKTGARSYTDALNMLGAKAAADFKNFVTTGTQIPPPNAPATLERKMARDHANWVAKGAKSRKKPGTVFEGPVMAPRTLVDTGRMVGAITWLVVPKSSLGANSLSRAQRAFVPPKNPRVTRRKAKP